MATRRLTVTPATVMLVTACGTQAGDIIATGSTSASPGSIVEPTQPTGPTEPQVLVAELEAARASIR